MKEFNNIFEELNKLYEEASHDMFITMAVGGGDENIYYIGYDRDDAWQALSNLYPDWDNLGLGGGDTNPVVIQYVGSKFGEFDKLVKKFRAGDELDSWDLDVLGWTNYHEFLVGDNPNFEYLYDAGDLSDIS